MIPLIFHKANHKAAGRLGALPAGQEVAVISRYIVRRLVISVVVLFGVSIMLYSLIRLMPSDFVSMHTSTSLKMTPEMKEHLRELYGLDKGIVGGYLDWLKGVFSGDLGTSFIYARPVTEVIGEFAPITFAVAIISFIFEVGLAIPLGILAARKQYTRTDYAITALVFVGISLPTFFFAAILKRAFGFYGLDILPTSGMLEARITYDGFSLAMLADYAAHLVLPISCFVITGVGGWLRYVRTMMLDALSSDYVRTARAKGVPERRVVHSHAFRNTLIPIVTMLGNTIPGLFSGAAITEGIFALGGLGSIAMRASLEADIPFLMGFNMFLVICTIVGYLLSDILYAVVDPRVRLS